ncbi:MAG TPA: hypothetical protein VFI80_09690 [Burkholderiales bacterium]|nr:hypothetical protein [Burkholderiales bacterium]
MPTLASPRATGGKDLVALASLCKTIRKHLHARRNSLAAEIRSYPTPIPRCDAQFNHLHEQQVRLARELERVGDAETGGRAQVIEAIESFIASAPYSDDAAEREFRARVKREFAGQRK